MIQLHNLQIKNGPKDLDQPTPKINTSKYNQTTKQELIQPMTARADG